MILLQWKRDTADADVTDADAIRNNKYMSIANAGIDTKYMSIAEAAVSTQGAYRPFQINGTEFKVLYDRTFKLGTASVASDMRHHNIAIAGRKMSDMEYPTPALIATGCYSNQCHRAQGHHHQ